jgi:hypothetical protein
MSYHRVLGLVLDFSDYYRSVVSQLVGLVQPE